MPAYLNRTGASRSILAAAALALAVVSSACKKDTTAPLQMVAENTTLQVNSTITSALVGTAFSFPGGAGALSSAVAGQNLAMTFGGTSTSPTAAMTITNSSGGTVGTISTNVTFGSCIFAVTASTFPAGHALAQGQTITVNPCNIWVGTSGAVANGVATTRSVALLLGNASSANASVTVGVNAGGQLTLNGNTVGTVTLTPISG
ncbi:MAG: hypothetical protein ACYC7F_06580 [Gemmatimonadaceae bacterium]